MYKMETISFSFYSRDMYFDPIDDIYSRVCICVLFMYHVNVINFY